jgi:CotS family spore coat protein
MDDRRWVSVDKGCLYLCDYQERRPISISDQQELETVFRELSRMHQLLKGFSPGPPGSSPLPFSQQWETDRERLLDYRGRSDAKDRKNAFESFFLEESDRIVSQVDKACRLLWDTDYEYLRGDYSDTVCHGSFKETNLFWTPLNELYTDRFDDCHYNLRTYDLGRLLYRVMAGRGWDPGLGKSLLEAYQELEPIDKEENKIMAAFLSYPHPAVAYTRAYYEQREGCSPHDLADAMRRESLRLKNKETFIDWLTLWKS